MPALWWTEVASWKENYHPAAVRPLKFGQFHSFPVWPSIKWYPSEILMLVIGRLGRHRRRHPVTDLIAKPAERVPHCSSFLHFYFREYFTSTRSLVGLTSSILITSEASPGVKGSIVTVENYSSMGRRCPSTKNIISPSTPCLFSQWGTFGCYLHLLPFLCVPLPIPNERHHSDAHTIY